MEEGGERRGKNGQEGEEREEEGGQGKAECIRGAAGEVSASMCVSVCLHVRKGAFGDEL